MRCQGREGALRWPAAPRVFRVDARLAQGRVPGLILTSVNLIGVLCFDAIMVLTGTGIHPHLAAVLCFVVLQSLATSLIYSIVEIAADPRTAGIVSAILCYAWILLPGDLPDYATPYVAERPTDRRT